MPARKAHPIMNLAFTFGACAAAAAAAFALYCNKPHRFWTKPVKIDKEDIDEKGLVMNCELSLACDSMHRKCPGYKKCGPHECCGFGIREETELVHEADTAKASEPITNTVSHAAPAAAY